MAVSGTPVRGYLLSFGHLVVNPVHFLMKENFKRGQSRDDYIISLFN